MTVDCVAGAQANYFFRGRVALLEEILVYCGASIVGEGLGGVF